MFEQLVDIICNYVEIEQEDIKPESRFMEDLGFTSFDFMSMLGEIEDEMDVEIEQDKAADIRTVGEAVAYLESLKQREKKMEYRTIRDILTNAEKCFGNEDAIRYKIGKNEIEIKQQMLKIIPQLKNLGNTGNR